MNICILSHRYPSSDNMVHVFVMKLVNEWAKNGHHCVVISPISLLHQWVGKEKSAPAYEKQDIGNGAFVEVFRPRYLTIPKLKLGKVNFALNSWQRTIEKTIIATGLDFDVIYCHFFKMAMLGWHYSHLHHKPLFVATGESKIVIPPASCKDFTVEKFRETLTGAICVSSKNLHEALSLNLIKPEYAKVFPNGVNLKSFGWRDKKICRSKLGIDTDKFVIVCVGQFIERKGQDRIIKALEKLNHQDISSIFIGKGTLDFEHQSIVFKGTVSNELIPDYLNAADVFVLPTRHEGCCNAIVEALACGLPVISSDREFNHDILNASNSILVDPDNVDDIADAIEILYYDRERCSELAAGAFASSKALSIEQRAENIMMFMQSQIAKN